MLKSRSGVGRIVRVGTVIGRRTTRLIKTNRQTRITRVVPYVVDYYNNTDPSIEYVKSLLEVFVETEVALTVFYVLMAAFSIHSYKTPKSEDE
jgi:hypothetical protein|uniref:Uncharacterized protein n=1 Tax=Micromonas commoda virus TaxID=3057169 RepID=A0AAU7YQT6_9PHYC